MNKIFIESAKENSNEAYFIETLVSSLSLGNTELVYVGGYTNLDSHTNKFLEHEDDSEKNLVIFDADYPATGGGFEARKRWLEEKKKALGIQFEFFLFPNNQDDGMFETLLQRMVNPKYEKLLSYFKEYEKKVEYFNESLGGNVFETPDEKARIYSYISAFKRSRKAKEDFKGGQWDFGNQEYWNLASTALEPLKDFLRTHIGI